MNVEMAYLLGMICGNGEIQRGQNETTIAISIPHKKLLTENSDDVRIYVKASIADIKNVLEPLLSSGVEFIQGDYATVISFHKSNTDYLMREILRMVDTASTRHVMRIPGEVFTASQDDKRAFLQGFADVTGYVRRSNMYYKRYEHRVYLEVPHNWKMVVDICNLLKSIDVPVQSIDWAHPNMRDGSLAKYNSGNPDFWKKEHQIKIWANEFMKIGFGVIHKQQALETFSAELEAGIRNEGRDPRKVTHRFYWDGNGRDVQKPHHPGENDNYIDPQIKGKHYNSWREIAEDLGYAH